MYFGFVVWFGGFVVVWWVLGCGLDLNGLGFVVFGFPVCRSGLLGCGLWVLGVVWGVCRT